MGTFNHPTKTMASSPFDKPITMRPKVRMACTECRSARKRCHQIPGPKCKRCQSKGLTCRRQPVSGPTSANDHPRAEAGDVLGHHGEVSGDVAERANVSSSSRYPAVQPAPSGAGLPYWHGYLEAGGYGDGVQGTGSSRGVQDFSDASQHRQLFTGVHQTFYSRETQGYTIRNPHTPPNSGSGFYHGGSDHPVEAYRQQAFPMPNPSSYPLASNGVVTGSGVGPVSGGVQYNASFPRCDSECGTEFHSQSCPFRVSQDNYY